MDLMCLCLVYARAIMSGFGCRRATARYSWRAVGTWMGSMLVYVFFSISIIVLVEVRFVFFMV